MDVGLAWERRLELLFVDVRSAQEWAAGHVPGARNIPLAEIAAYAPALRRLMVELAIVDADHSSTAGAADRVQSALGIGVWEVTGGVAAWRAAALPLALL